MAGWAKTIEEAARDRLRTDGDVFYDDSKPPIVEIVSKTDREVIFIAHRYVYSFAQSGSDWADHYILRGKAILDGEHVVSLDLQPHHVRLTEREHDEYDPAQVVKQLAADMVKQATT